MALRTLGKTGAVLSSHILPTIGLPGRTRTCAPLLGRYLALGAVAPRAVTPSGKTASPRLGEPPRPPFPEGFEVEPTDEELLERLRARKRT